MNLGRIIIVSKQKRRGWCIVPRLSDDLEFHYRILGYTREYYLCLARGFQRLDSSLPCFPCLDDDRMDFWYSRVRLRYSHSASTLSTLSIDAEITSRRWRRILKFSLFIRLECVPGFLYVRREYRCVIVVLLPTFLGQQFLLLIIIFGRSRSGEVTRAWRSTKLISTFEEKVVIVEERISFLKKKKINFTVNEF